MTALGAFSSDVDPVRLKEMRQNKTQSPNPLQSGPGLGAEGQAVVGRQGQVDEDHVLSS
jgi:hypothetical protein